MTKIPNYSLSYVSRASGYENIPRLNTAAQPVGGIDISNSAYLGHLIHEPQKAPANHPLTRILHLAERSPDDFDALFELSELAVKAVSYYDRRWLRPYDPASCALRSALSVIARQAHDDRTYLEQFHARCLSEDRNNRDKDLWRTIQELADVAANHPDSPEFFLLEALASFNLRYAKIEYSRLMRALKYGVNTSRPDWKEVRIPTVDMHSIPPRSDRPTSLVPRAVQRNMEIVRNLIWTLVDRDVDRIDEASRLSHHVERFVPRSLELATGDIAAWIMFLKEGETYVNPLPTKTMGVEPSQVMIYATYQGANDEQSLQMMRNLGAVALDDPYAFQYLYFLHEALIYQFEDTPEKNDFNSAMQNLQDTILDAFDVDRIVALVETYPSITFTAIDRIAHDCGARPMARAFFQLDAKRMLASWIREGLHPDVFFTTVLPIMYGRDNDSAKAYVLELEGASPDSDRVEHLPPPKQDGEQD